MKFRASLNKGEKANSLFRFQSRTAMCRIRVSTTRAALIEFSLSEGGMHESGAARVADVPVPPLKDLIGLTRSAAE